MGEDPGIGEGSGIAQRILMTVRIHLEGGASITDITREALTEISNRPRSESVSLVSMGL